jgi:integrase
MSLSDLRHAEA